MIKYLNYKDRPAISIEGRELKATFLPDDGAKMVSLIRIRDQKELLAVKQGERYRTLAYDGEYVLSECSGFDDMFPTVDPFTPVDGGHRGVTYPDHGEICRLPFSTKEEENSIVFQTQSRLFPIRYQKRVSVEGSSIVVHYRIDNFGEVPFAFLWAGHMMLQGEEGLELITPFSKDDPTEIMFSPPNVDVLTLPKDRLMNFVPQIGPAYKFYYTEQMKKGRFGVRYRDGSALLFDVDPEKLPYLGIWLNNGGFQNSYTVTPEPCTIPYDSPERAAKHGISSVLQPQGNFEFQIKITAKEKYDI